MSYPSSMRYMKKVALLYPFTGLGSWKYKDGTPPVAVGGAQGGGEEVVGIHARASLAGARILDYLIGDELGEAHTCWWTRIDLVGAVV